VNYSRAPVMIASLILVAAAATACETEKPRSDTGLEYAALGDSYTAAPFLPESSTDGCVRSDQNYPHQVAEQLPDVTLIDVSCGGATTEDVLRSQDLADGVHPPQLEAVSETTDLVTVGLGVNDLGFPSKAVYDCLLLAQNDPRGAPCERANSREVSRVLDQIQGRLVDVVDAIEGRAPEARILVVGYPRLLPKSGGCRERLALAKGDVDFVRASYDELYASIEAAATEAGVEYVDVTTASEGHDICAEDTWINGDRKDRRTKAAPYHPLPAEQEAVAALILDLI
jgi:lysophospholipase L1-like esterase